MSKELTDLALTAFVTLFLSGFFILWLQPQEDTVKKAVMKKFRAIVRVATKTKVPVLCANHAKDLIVRKGKMALISNADCELCNKKSYLT